MSQIIKTERIYALDALRAVMMLLGLVLHTSASYGQIDKLDEWPFLDPKNTHLIFDVFLGLIHLFRMPIFFLISGFFGALLFYERSPRRMLINRFKRIVLPFIVFLFLLHPILQFTFGSAVFRFTGESDVYTKAWVFAVEQGFFSNNASHLWFLYYLALFSFLTWGFAFCLRAIPGLGTKIREVFIRVHKSLLTASLVCALPLLLFFHWMQAPDAYTSTSLIPDLRTFFYYIFFYWYGWILFKEKELLVRFQRGYQGFLLAGILLFSVKAGLYLQFKPEEVLYPIIVCNVFAVWCFIYAICGWFLKKFNQKSERMRYISDASYWVYLVHLPLTAFLPQLLFDYDIFVGFKWLFVLSLTTAFCFLTYHYCVRSTFIGRFLNGRKF